MATFRIPSSQLTVFKFLATASVEDFAAIEAALRDLPLCLQPEQHERELSKLGPLQDRLEPEDLMSALVSLQIVRSRIRKPTEELVKDFLRAFESQAKDSGDSDILARLGERVFRLLQAPTIRLIAKASQLRGDFGQLLMEAKIVTDLRPVFGEDISTGPEAMFITSTLQIEYASGSAVNEMHFAMDREDLVKLQQVVERAIKKADSLHTLLGEFRVREIEN